MRHEGKQNIRDMLKRS